MAFIYKGEGADQPESKESAGKLCQRHETNGSTKGAVQGLNAPEMRHNAPEMRHTTPTISGRLVNAVSRQIAMQTPVSNIRKSPNSHADPGIQHPKPARPCTIHREHRGCKEKAGEGLAANPDT